MSAEVEVLRDDDEIQAIESLLSAGVLPREPRQWMEYCLKQLPEEGHPNMRPDDRARWATQHRELRTQYELLERLIHSYAGPRAEAITVRS